MVTVERQTADEQERYGWALELRNAIRALPCAHIDDTGEPCPQSGQLHLAAGYTPGEDQLQAQANGHVTAWLICDACGEPQRQL